MGSIPTGPTNDNVTLTQAVLPIARRNVTSGSPGVLGSSGEAAGDVARIASGGERSRIHLGLVVMGLEDRKEPPLQLFDEVDAGLGMDHALAVADLLGRLADGGQVLCVTHLPQVAAQGHHHLQVSKGSDEKSVETRLDRLEADQKVAEIARMLGGVKITDQTLAHAREMLAQA